MIYGNIFNPKNTVKNSNYKLILALLTITFMISCSKDNTTFTPSLPIINTMKLSEIERTCNINNVCSSSVKGGGIVISDGGAIIIEYGLCYSTHKTPTIADRKYVVGSGKNTFTCTLPGLNSDSTYFVRAYATTTVGTGYGNVVVFNPKLIDFDGNVYTIVTIGTQTWMAENLIVTHFRNGDKIPELTDKTAWSNRTSGACCNYNNDSNNVSIYGRLYNYYALTDERNICPQGWHIPSETEWKLLCNYLGNDSLVGEKLKENGTEHWLSPNLKATNEYGFSGLPGGYRSFDGDFGGFRMNASWWSSTEADTKIAWSYDLNYINSNLVIRGSDKRMGFSIRCIKDK
jgi:uncharacterized protein (TIGR02145 family)